jgi:hypothetical protein
MRSLRVACATAIAALAAAVLWASPSAGPSEAEARKKIVETAQSFRGVPYVYGAESPEAFDCSGFVQYVYSRAADIDIPRNSRGQWAAGKPVEKADAKPGDIFVFDTSGSGSPSHVAIYLGNDSIIHAVSEGPATGVVVSPLGDRYFGPRYMGARYFIVSMPQGATSDADGSQAAAPKASAAAQAKVAPATQKAPAATPKAAAAQAPVAQGQAPTAQAQAPAKSAAAASQSVAAAKADDPPVAQIGFTVTGTPSIVTDKIPAATGTAIAFTITNGTGKDGVFHVYFYKADVDFKKTKVLREDRAAIKAGASCEIEAYTFSESGVYRLNVKTADNTQLMQRTWKVVDVRR